MRHHAAINDSMDPTIKGAWLTIFHLEEFNCIQNLAEIQVHNRWSTASNHDNLNNLLKFISLYNLCKYNANQRVIDSNFPASARQIISSLSANSHSHYRSFMGFFLSTKSKFPSATHSSYQADSLISGFTDQGDLKGQINDNEFIHICHNIIHFFT